MSDNKFEIATRSKLRFPSSKGDLSIEQLWGVPLRSRDDFNLDTVAKGAKRALDAATEVSFVETKKHAEADRLALALDLVKHVINVLLEEEATATKRAANKVEREKLLAILAEKQAGQLSDLSVNELQKRINALDT